VLGGGLWGGGGGVFIFVFVLGMVRSGLGISCAFGICQVWYKMMLDGARCGTGAGAEALQWVGERGYTA
jgi:hypothetical protein